MKRIAINTGGGVVRLTPAMVEHIAHLGGTILADPRLAQHHFGRY